MNTGRTHFKKGMIAWNKGTHFCSRPAGYKQTAETIKI